MLPSLLFLYFLDLAIISYHQNGLVFYYKIFLAFYSIGSFKTDLSIYFILIPTILWKSLLFTKSIFFPGFPNLCAAIKFLCKSGKGI
jgi:hypothetical protein